MVFFACLFLWEKRMNCDDDDKQEVITTRQVVVVEGRPQYTLQADEDYCTHSEAEKQHNRGRISNWHLSEKKRTSIGCIRDGDRNFPLPKPIDSRTRHSTRPRTFVRGEVVPFSTRTKSSRDVGAARTNQKRSSEEYERSVDRGVLPATTS
jgi:hypothetical protein